MQHDDSAMMHQMAWWGGILWHYLHLTLVALQIRHVGHELSVQKCTQGFWHVPAQGGFTGSIL